MTDVGFPLPKWALELPEVCPAVWRAHGLGPRLSALAAAVPEGARVADIGTDHARLPEALVVNHHVERAIACDRADRPLASARLRLEKNRRLGERLELRLGEGFGPLGRGEVDTAILAGFGAQKMVAALEVAPLEALGITRLILQPTAGLPRLRRFLAGRGFHFRRDTIVREGSRGFITVLAEAGGRPRTPSPLGALVGAVEPDHPLLAAWLEAQHAHLLRQGARGRALRLEVEAWLRDARARPESSSNSARASEAKARELP